MHMGSGLKDSIQIIRYARNPELGLEGDVKAGPINLGKSKAATAVKYRVVDSATVGDRSTPQGKVEKVIKEMSGKSPGCP